METFLKAIWRTKAPPEITSFGWTTIHDAILIPDNLKKWGLILCNRSYIFDQKMVVYVSSSFRAVLKNYVPIRVVKSKKCKKRQGLLEL